MYTCTCHVTCNVLYRVFVPYVYIKCTCTCTCTLESGQRWGCWRGWGLAVNCIPHASHDIVLKVHPVWDIKFYVLLNIYCCTCVYVCLFYSRVILDRVHLADDSEVDQKDETAELKRQDTVPVSSLESQASVESVNQTQPQQNSDKKPPGTEKEEVSDTLHRYTCSYSTAHKKLNSFSQALAIP